MSAPTVELAGVVDGMPEEQYHAHGALSSSGAKLLLPPNCPAIFHYRRSHPERRPEFDLGHAAHLMVLGAGPALVVVDADDWRTKAAKQQRDEAHEAGNVPLLRQQHEDVKAMAAALRAHPFAGRLFQPGTGRPEVSLFWRDELAGIDCRARLDWVPDRAAGRLVVADYKSAATADPGRLRRSMFDFGYHVQAWWNLDGLAAAGLDDGSAAFVFVVQEKAPPYLVTVVQLDADAMRLGERDARRARDVFAECTATGHWPGYASDVELISPPPWLIRDLEES